MGNIFLHSRRSCGARLKAFRGSPPVHDGDAPPMGRALLRSLGYVDEPIAALMDKAYEGDDTRTLASDLGFNPVVPPKANR